MALLANIAEIGGQPMLTRDQLADLYRGLQQEKVLTVYLDGVGKDPARRRVWRRRLAQEMEREEHRIGLTDSHERQAFEAARERVMREVDGFQSFLPGKGFVAFATADDIRHLENLPVQVPNLVRWGTGPRVSPYVRGLKQLRPMVTALVDGRRGRVFLYKEGEVTEVLDLRSDTVVGDLSDVGTRTHSAAHSGSRGQTATDAAQRYLELGKERMLKDVKELVCELAGDDGFVLLGGDQDALSVLRPMMPSTMERRILENSSLRLEMTLPEVKAASAEGASALAKRRQEALLNQVMEQAYSRGNGCLGGQDTVRALDAGAVDILILSRPFVEVNPDYADQCVTKAFEQGAEVRVFGGAPSDRLDEVGGGIGARLRFRPEIPEEVPA